MYADVSLIFPKFSHHALMIRPVPNHRHPCLYSALFFFSTFNWLVRPTNQPAHNALLKIQGINRTEFHNPPTIIQVIIHLLKLSFLPFVFSLMTRVTSIQLTQSTLSNKSRFHPERVLHSLRLKKNFCCHFV